jgi:serine phosphatase RsbU (regulator of sigma subunit)
MPAGARASKWMLGTPATFAALLGISFSLALPSSVDAAHGRGGKGPQQSTPVNTAPYGGTSETTAAEAAETASGTTGAATTTTASTTPSVAADATGADKEASGGATAKPGAAKGKIKHAAKREAKSGHKTPEASAARGGTEATQGSGSGSTTGGVTGSQGNTPGGVSAAGSPIAEAPAASSGAAPSGGSGAPAIGSAGVGKSAKAHRRAVAHRHAAATAGAGVAAAAAAGLGHGVTGTTLQSDASAAREPATTAVTHHRSRPAPSSEPPIVRSVTRFIEVVPPLMRVLIGALVAIALLLAASSRIVALRARRLLRQREQLLDDVGLLQAALLPPLPPRIGPVGTSAAYRPASGPGAGGDFYDVFALGDGQIAVIVGDVSGHGRDALPQTTLVRFTLRAYLEAGLSPRAALATAGPVLERQLGSSFATVVLATYNPRDRELTYSCAGHPPPVLMGSETLRTITASAAPPIGVGAATGTRQTTVSVPGGALACFYTDGVVEARTGGELYGSSRLTNLLGRVTAEANADELLDRVAAETDKRPDDMAACLLRIDGAAAAPAVRVEELELDERELGRDRAGRFLRAAGVHPAEVQAMIGELHRAIGRHGRVVLELHLGEGEPEFVVRPQNVATLQPSIRALASAQGALS